MSKHVLKKHLSNFTIVSNNIIDALQNDIASLGFYLYVLSLPDDWTFYKTTLAKQCGIGMNKLEKILKKLGSIGLVQCGQKRNEHGQFSGFFMDIYDLDTLKINDLTPDVKKHRTVNTEAPLQQAIQETYTKETILNKQDKNICPSDDGLLFFDQFYSLYPKKQKRIVAKDIWKKQGYDSIAQIIIENIEQRLKFEWPFIDKKFIPLPDTYLRQKRWTDELALSTMSVKKESGMERALRLCLN